MDVYTTRHMLASGRLVQELNVCTVLTHCDPNDLGGMAGSLAIGQFPRWPARGQQRLWLFRRRSINLGTKYKSPQKLRACKGLHNAKDVIYYKYHISVSIYVLL